MQGMMITIIHHQLVQWYKKVYSQLIISIIVCEYIFH